MLIYHETRENPEEDYEALVEPIAQPIAVVKPASVVVNKFIDYQYVELSEEKYESKNNSDIKIITL